MSIEVRRVKRHFARSRIGVAPALAALTIGVVKLGLAGTTVAVLLTAGVIAVLALIYRAVYRRRLRRESGDGVLLVAEANFARLGCSDGADQGPSSLPARPGVIRFRKGSIELAPKNEDVTTLNRSDIQLVELAPISFFPATQARFVLTSGSEIQVPITAPVNQVERAVLSV